MAEVAAFDGLLLVHAEDSGTIATAPAPAGRSYAGLPALAPGRGGGRRDRHGDRRWPARTGARVHVVHLSSAGSLEQLADGTARTGCGSPSETCPHYLTLAADDVPDGATRVQVLPADPRTGPTRTRCGRACGRDGVDMVVSDHSPCPPSSSTWTTATSARRGAASRRCSSACPSSGPRPARAGTRWRTWWPGWPSARPSWSACGAREDRRRPRRRPGRASAPDEPFRCDRQRSLHRHPLTPYAGRELTGVVRRTWLRGIAVDDDHRARHGCWLREDG